MKSHERAGQPPLIREGKPYMVVGVVPDVRFRSLDVESGREIYCSIAADPRPFLWNLYVRVAGGTLVGLLASHWLVQSVRGSLYRVDGNEAWIWVLAIVVVLVVGTGGHWSRRRESVAPIR